MAIPDVPMPAPSTPPGASAPPFFAVPHLDHGPITLTLRGALGDHPAAAFAGGLPQVAGNLQQLTNLFPSLALTDVTAVASGAVAPQVTYTFSAALHQDLQEPVTNPDQAQFLLSRRSWEAQGGSGLNPAYFFQVEDAYLLVGDPSRHGGVQVGQFRVPLGYDDWATYRVPVAIAPDASPLFEAGLPAGSPPAQPSTLTWRRDIGATIFADPGPYAWAVGAFNGSGPNRPDDNPDKDLFARLDLRDGTTEVGASFMTGADLAYPQGFAGPPASYGRRDWDLHGRYAFGGGQLTGEWVTDLRIGQDTAPRRGYVVQWALGGGNTPSVSPLGNQVGPYAQYADFTDPNNGAWARQVALGTIVPLSQSLATRAEVAQRWEGDPTRNDSFTRYVLELVARI